MSKLQKTILISLLVLFAPVFAQAADLDVQFEQGPPLFDEVNFFPGQFVTKWVDVTNNTAETKTIGVEATKYTSCSQDCLSDQLELEINKGGPNLYEASLTDFFTAGQKKLSEVGASSTTRYYFTVTFLPDAGNVYQNKEVGFDFDIGFFGQETIGEEIGGGSSSGGSFGGSIGLIIFDENASSVVSGETDITWETNRPATSRVIYSSQYESHIFDLSNPPNYGYARSNVEDPFPVINHSMNIGGLIPGVTYYYRVVSRGSFAVSVEHSFTVPGVKAAETGSEQGGPGEVAGTEETPEITGGETAGGGIVEEATEEESQNEENPASLFLASLKDLFKLDFCSIFFLLIIIVTILLLLSLEKQRKTENEIKKWVLSIAAIIILIILYGLICPYYKTLLIVIGIIFVLFLLWYYFKKDKETGQKQI